MADKKKFVLEYIKNGGNATQAAIKAGYSEKTARSQGQRLLTKADIQKELEKERQKIRKDYEYSMAEMMAELNDVQEKADRESNRAAQLKAIELKGKAAGLFVDKVKSELTLKQALVVWDEVDSEKVH